MAAVTETGTADDVIWARQAIRSCLATADRHGITWLDALTHAAEGHPWLPEPA